MAWEPFEIQGFMPDLPQNIPGSVFEGATPGSFSYGLYPTARGVRNGPWPEITSTTGGTSGALDTVSLGAKLVYKTDGSYRVFVGTAAKLWEFNGGTTITDRSGGSMLATTSETWSFTQFGDITLAANRLDFLQQIGAGAAFAAVGSAPVPKASIAVTCGPTSAPFVMVFDYNDGTNTYRDGWINSAISDPATSAAASWTPGTAQCANGRLLDDLPGPITAAVAYRDGVIAFKPSGMYLGTYDTKLAAAWSWERLSRDIGCIGKNCVVSINDEVWWADARGIFTFDGSYPKRVPGHVHKWWADLIAQEVTGAATRHFVRVLWDKRRRNLWFLVPGGVSDTNCQGLVYHLDSQIWMPWTSFANTAGTVLAQEIIEISNTYDQFGFFIGDNKKLGVLNFAAGSGSPPAAAVTFGVMGSNTQTTTVNNIRLSPIVAPAVTTAISSAFVTAGKYWRQGAGVTGTNQTFAANGEHLALNGTAGGRFLQPAVVFAAGNDIEIAYKGGAINMKMAGDA